MSEKKNIFNAFKSASLSDWQKVAREELNGADPTEKLVHQDQDWALQPFYDRIPKRAGQPLLSASGNQFLGARAWYNCPRVIAEEAVKMNEKAIASLKQGADGVLFELEDDVDFEILLKGIEWQYCSLNFLAKKNSASLADSLQQFMSRRKMGGHELHGAFFGNIVRPHAIAGSSFSFSGFQMTATSSPIEQIVQCLYELANTPEKKLKEFTAPVAFSIGVDTDFFLALAKLRAVRVLWNILMGAVRPVDPIPMLIHAYARPWPGKVYEPNGMMLKGTTAAMSAILGGADILTIDPEQPGHPTMSRVAQNISNILREESYFSKVADPVAGSYLIEDLTLQLVDSAWALIRLTK